MLIQLRNVLLLMITCALMTPISGLPDKGNDSALLKEIQKTITDIHKMRGTTQEHLIEAKRLATLTKKIDPNAIDDKTLKNLTSLLNEPEDSVRFWVTVSIGNLGPRAKEAVPALLKDIREMDCTLGEVTSAGSARVALKRIGVAPPPLTNCKGKWKLPNKAQIHNSQSHTMGMQTRNYTAVWNNLQRMGSE